MKFTKYANYTIYSRKLSRIDHSLLHICMYSLPQNVRGRYNHELFTKITFRGKHLSKCLNTFTC